MRREVGNDVTTWRELVADAFEAMRLHHRGHDLAIDGERHVDDALLHQRRPVLIAERVAELDASAHGKLGR